MNTVPQNSSYIVFLGTLATQEGNRTISLDISIKYADADADADIYADADDHDDGDLHGWE